MPPRRVLAGVVLGCALVVGLVAAQTRPESGVLSSASPVASPSRSTVGSPTPSPLASPASEPSAPAPSSTAPLLSPSFVPTSLPTLGGPASPRPAPPAQLPLGGRRIFPGHILVAYYGTAGTGALGVLGEERPDKITERLRRAARPFGASGYQVQIVYELIVSVADAYPGKDGNYSHDISRAAVQRYIDAAHRNKALLVLDLQPGRSDFLTVAKRWAWALKDPWVGLAIDPEWRMGQRQVPARVVGHVGAREVNAVSKWLSDLTVSHDLPQKLFMVHQFRYDMVRDIGAIVRRPSLAMVQHVDGFGSRGAKLSTLHAVARPKQFTMGFKLFYDEDIHRFRAADVLRLHPRIRFVSFQ